MHRTQSNEIRQHCSRRQEVTHTRVKDQSTGSMGEDKHTSIPTTLTPRRRHFCFQPHSLSAWPGVVNPVQGNVRSIRRIHFNLSVFTHPQSSKYVHPSKVILYRSNMFLILHPQHAQMRGLFAEEGSIKIWAQIAATTTILSVTCKLCFVARLSLEPTRMRWKDDQVRTTTSLETREANVQECNGVKSVCGSTLPQLGLALRPS